LVSLRWLAASYVERRREPVLQWLPFRGSFAEALQPLQPMRPSADGLAKCGGIKLPEPASEPVGGFSYPVNQVSIAEVSATRKGPPAKPMINS
jgi:hypothetical protein